MIGPARYASWRATWLGGITERLEHDLLLSLSGPLTERRVLDIGCGDGALTGRLVAGGAVVTAIDSEPEMVAEAAVARAWSDGFCRLRPMVSPGMIRPGLTSHFGSSWKPSCKRCCSVWSRG